MSASSSVPEVTGVDYVAARCVAVIEGNYPGPKSYCSRVKLSIGAEPSTAEVIVPLAKLDNNVPAVAGVLASPVEKIKHGNLSVVTAQLVPQIKGVENPQDTTKTMLSGTVQHIRRDLALDKAILTIKDHRYLMRGVPIVGAFWANINNEGNAAVAYRQGVKMHVNPNNQPNGIWAQVERTTGTSLVPVFCSPFFGVGTGTVAAASDQDQTKAFYHTPSTLLQYLEYATSVDAQTLAQNGGKFPEFVVRPDLVIWPESLTSFLADNQTVDRKAFETVIYGKFLMPLIDELCRAAGPFGPYMVSNDDGTNTLAIRRTRYKGQNQTNPGPSADANTGITLDRAFGGQAVDDLTGPTIIGGHVTTDSENCYPIIMLTGEHPVIECRCVSPAFQGAAGVESGYVPMVYPYPSADVFAASVALTNAMNYPNSDGTFGRDQAESITAVFQAYDVCGSVQLQPGFDFQVGTNQEGFPVAFVGRIPLPELLSSLPSSGLMDDFQRSNSRYKISVEVNKTNDDVSWEDFTEKVNLNFLGDGTIDFSSVRDQEAKAGVTDGIFYTITRSGNYGAESWYITPNRVRMTLAIPCDHRLTSALSVPGASDTITPAKVDSDDSAQMDFSRFVRTMAVDTGALFASEERSTAFPPYPIPQSQQQLPAHTPFPAAGSDDPKAVALYGNETVLRDDSSYAFDQNVRKINEFGRLDRASDLEADRLDLTAEPGDMIDALSNSDGSLYPIKAIVKTVVHDFAGNPRQNTRRQLV